METTQDPCSSLSMRIPANLAAGNFQRVQRKNRRGDLIFLNSEVSLSLSIGTVIAKMEHLKNSLVVS